MKQVWILNHYALGPKSPGGTRHFHLAKALPEFGWHATIIAASVELNSGRQRISKKHSHQLEYQNGVPFLWVYTPEYQDNGIGRMINMLTYSARSLFPHITRSLPKPDIIIGSSVHPFAAFSGAILAIKHRIPFIFEVRDLWPLTLIDLNRIKENSLIARTLGALEKWLCNRASIIITLLPNADNYYANLSIPKEKIIWIPNGVDLSLFDIDISHECKKKEYTSPFSLMYFGAHGQANGLETLIKAMKLVSDKAPKGSIILRMIGDGPEKINLMELALKLNLSNIKFESSIPKQKIPEVAQSADGFLLPIMDKPRLYKYGISMNKLFDYLAAGRPIIIASNAINNPIADAHAGITVKPDNPEELCEAIIKLSNLPIEKRLKMGAAGREYVKKHHNFSKLAKRLATIMDECHKQ